MIVAWSSLAIIIYIYCFIKVVLAHCAVYLARAPKSGEIYRALRSTVEKIRSHVGPLPGVCTYHVLEVKLIISSSIPELMLVIYVSDKCINASVLGQSVCVYIT